MTVWWIVAAVLVTAAVAAGVALIRQRRRRPRTKAEQLRAARTAMKGLRAADGRARRRPYLGRSDTASRTDRYSAAIAENATYSDAGDYSGGGGGGGSD